MIYRVGRVEDLPQITSMLCISGYYAPMNAADMGGVWVVAEHNEQIVGCIWAFSDGRNAFVDYFYVKPPFRGGKTPARLLSLMEWRLRQSGVRSVRTTIKSDNLDALRLVQAVGVWTDRGYSLGYKEL